MHPFLKLVVFLIVSLLLYRCASISSVPGGARDEQPPQVVLEKSTPNEQTLFQKQPIELYFDEWVVLGNPGQVVVSPPLSYPLDIKLRGKRLEIRFDEKEVLRENATYTLNFGEVVKDLNEGNAAQDLRFVFATGPVLDTLQLSGFVVDAFSGDPVEEALVTLYDNLSDTAFRTERPFYFAKTDASGRFQLFNLKADTFRLYALTDNNFNYYYDLPDESIAFYPSPLVLPDSVLLPRLRLFQEPVPIRVFSDGLTDYGKLTVAFSRKPDSLDWQLTKGGDVQTTRYPDSLLFWLPNADTSTVIYLFEKGQPLDTLNVGTIAQPEKAPPLELNAFVPLPAKLPIHQNFPLDFLRPIQRWDTSQFRLLQDSISIDLQIQPDSLDGRRLFISFSKTDTAEYQLRLLPGAVTDLFGQTHDTIQHKFGLQPATEFGNLSLTILNLEPGKAYWLELMRTSADPVRTAAVQPAADSLSLQYKKLPPGQYTVRLTADENENRRWDPGNLDNRRQPEPIQRFPLEQLRANWDLDATIEWTE